MLLIQAGAVQLGKPVGRIHLILPSAGQANPFTVSVRLPQKENAKLAPGHHPKVTFAT